MLGHPVSRRHVGSREKTFICFQNHGLSFKIETLAQGKIKHCTMSYSSAKYLIYLCFEEKHPMTASVVGGSYLLDSAMTDEEAHSKIEMYKERAKTCTYQYGNKNSRYTFIENKSEWWS